MQTICTSLQTDNHINTPSLNVYRPDAPLDALPTVSKHNAIVLRDVCMRCAAAVRLVGGASYGEGRLSIYNDLTGRWQPVCADAWTNSNADVVCRQLGFHAGAATGPQRVA